MQENPIAAIPGCELKPLGQLATKPASAIHASRFSVGCETLDRDMWNFDKAYPQIAALGAKWARLQTGWGKCEKIKGVYDFSWLDSVVDRLLAAGIQPWFNVSYGNGLYQPDAPHQTAVGWTPIGDTAAQEGWIAYVSALTRHFRGRVTYYEVWNEPDIKAFWTPYDPSPEAYAELVALTARTIRTADPEAKIIGGAVCCGLHQVGFDFIKGCFENGMGKHIDALSYHLYVPTPDGFYERQLPLLRELVDAYRPGLPLWQGESGAPSKAQAGQALAEYKWDEAKQAKWFARRSVIDLALNTPMIALFHAADFEFYIVKTELVRKP
ncbi:MAG TPA: beta-glucosidase, partial [Armatimonadota bacterium]|nr:beta-glucosidase [Armatimonadota bacterium]